ncbi:MAG TPA: PDR/VanB family oxidoreductase [Pseudonocardia sp.]|nr:PDR/VanB family oxidoreductase [Pseudonocardia sp.]
MSTEADREPALPSSPTEPGPVVASRPVVDVAPVVAPRPESLRRPPAEESIPEPTRFFRAMGAGINLMGRLSVLGRRPPVVAVNRELRLVIGEVRAEARDVVSLRLTPAPGAAAGAPLPAWRPGAHLDVVLPSGRVRQYSLCGDPADRGSYRIAVRRIADGGGGSREVHGLAAGAEVTVRGPRSAFPLIQAPRYLFLAGGIGITPILPMLRAVAATRADWRFVYAGRDRDSMPFLAELAELDPSRVVIRADAEHGGPPTGAELLGHAPGRGTTGYLCGPAPMLTAVRAELHAAGAASRVEALHVERFAAPPVLGGHAFTVELARSGGKLEVPADRSLLEVLGERLPDVAYSCRQGFCGTCRTRVLAGAVQHRDRVLTEAERSATMTICVSRAEGDRLVLDL